MEKIFFIDGEGSYYLHAFKYGGERDQRTGKYKGGGVERIVATEEQTIGGDIERVGFFCPCCNHRVAKTQKAAAKRVMRYGVIPLIEVHRYNSYEPQGEILRGVIAEEAVPEFPDGVVVQTYTETYDVCNNRIFHPDPVISKVVTRRGGKFTELEVSKSIPDHIRVGLGDKIKLEEDGSIADFPKLRHGPATNFCGGSYCSLHKNKEVCDGFKTSKYGRCSYQDGEPEYEWVQEPQALT